MKAEDESFQNILLLNSYHSTFKWTSDITRGVLDEFADPGKYRVFVEHLDAKRFQNEKLTKDFSVVFARKYDFTNIDGVIISDNKAFDFFLEHGDEIWGDVPVAFCGNNNIPDYDVDTTRFKGVDEQVNIDSTLQVIKTLQPGLEKLIVISDSTQSGTIFSRQFREVAEKNHPDLPYRLVNARTPSQLADTLQSICPEKKAIYLLSLYIDRNGITREMVREAGLIKDNCPAPVYSNWNFLFDDFMMGGVVIRGYDQGREAARILKELLKGDHDRPWLTPPRETLAFDYKQLNKETINNKSLTSKALLINKPEDFFDQFRREMLIAFLILVVLISIIIILLRIINQKRRIEKKLIKSESRLEMALEGANEGLWDADLMSGKIFLSQQFAKLLHYDTPGEIDFNTENYANLFHPEDRSQIPEAFQMHKNGNTPLFICEARIRKKSGHFNWFSIHGKITERDTAKRPLRMTGTITDIQAQKEFENQLKMSKEQAEEGDRLKSAFLANMSHEIRTPMNAILGFTDLLMNDFIDTPDYDQYLGMIKNSGENLLNLINDIIDISKIESGQLKIQCEHVDVHEILEKLENIAQNLINQKNKKLRFRVTHDVPDKQFYIHTDPYRLQQILLNLITNAIKFTDTGEIEVGYKLHDQRTLIFFVKDTGKGIAPAHKNIIFERFRQIDETSIKNQGGTGLGLAITKSLVTMMNGEIWLQSEREKGAVFSFSLPCRCNS
ncbi:MAG: ATP-binding protein [Marinilabilia sp.]